MRWLAALLTLLPATMSVAQVRSLEPIAPGLPFTGPDAPTPGGVISADGNVLVFHSSATNLVPEAKPSFASVYFQTLIDGKIHRVPTTTEFGEAVPIWVSFTGAKVAFSDLEFAYLYDRATNSVRNISYLPDGKLGTGTVAGMSGDGSKVLVQLRSRPEAASKFYLRDTSANQTSPVQLNSSGKGLSSFEDPILTQDGKYIFFRSFDPRLPKGATTFSIYRKSILTGDVDLVEGTGAELVQVDAVGRTGLIRTFELGKVRYSLYDFESKQKVLLRAGFYSPKLSSDGAYVVGTLGDTEPSSNGPIVAYRVRDGRWSTVRSASHRNHRVLSLSHDANRMVYLGLHSLSLLPDYPVPNASVCDLTGTEVPNIDSNLPGIANGRMGSAAVSADGARVAFVTNSSNLVADDISGSYQAFVRKVVENRTTLESVSADAKPVRGSVSKVAMSPNGRYLTYAVTRTPDSESFSVVVRDLNTSRNVGSKSFAGRVYDLKISNRAFVLVNGDFNFERSVKVLNPANGQVQDVNALIPNGSLMQDDDFPVWLSSNSDDCYIAIRDRVTGVHSLLRHSLSSGESQTIPLPTGTEVSFVSVDARIAWLSKNDSLEFRFDLVSLEASPSLRNFGDSFLVFSSNGRYAALGASVIDLEELRGWRVATEFATDLAVTDAGDLLTNVSGEVVGLGTFKFSQLLLARLGEPVPNPDTYVSAWNRLVQGSASLSVSGTSFQEPSSNLKFQYQIDGGSWSPAGPALGSLPLPYDGAILISVRAVDSAGNVDLTPATITVTNDTTAPQTTVITKTSKNAVKVSASASEGCAWHLIVRSPSGVKVFEEWTSDGSSSYEAVLSNLLPGTTYSYEIVALDQVRLETKKSGTFTTGS